VNALRRDEKPAGADRAPTPGDAAGRGPRDTVARYVVAASAARTADEGMAPALALLVAAAGRDPAFAGVLLAAAGLPHVATGPLAGAVLDASRHRRAVLALAPVLFGLVLAVTTLALDRVPDALCVALVAVAGCVGPLVTGGLSAELTRLVPARQGRALALDGASYNVAAIAGPAAVAGAAAIAGADAAALTLAAFALAAAAAVLRLPAAAQPAEPQRGWRTGLAGARRLWRSRPLRLVTAGTTIAFLGAGALPLLVIARADELGSAMAGAAALAGMAAGALAGALLTARGARDRDAGALLTARGARHRDAGARALAAGPPERRVIRALLAVAGAVALTAAAPSLATLGAALALAGLADGTLLPAILAVRSEQSRPAERGAVFTTAASIKIGAGATGAALGGVFATATGAGTALLAAAALHLAGALICLGYGEAS
jgi:MFS family permease